MSRKFSRRRVGVAAVVAALASLGGLDIALVTSGGSPTPELAQAVAQATPLASSQAQASPSTAAPAEVPSAGTVTVPAPSPVVTKPPPVIDGVRRVNVGSAHSPQLLQQLSSAPATMPPPADAGALGVDVADYQHAGGAAIDWSQVAGAGYKFAFIKATEGDYYVNPYYASDLAQAKAAGLYATGYHFAIPNVSSGASQADYAVANGGYAADGRTLPLALDIEYNPYGAECYGMSPAQIVSWVSAFTAEVQRVTSQLPIIYTTADWWNTCTDDSTAFGADPLWVAGYVSGNPPMPAGWGSWTFWQYTSRGSVPGITGNVDVSYFLQAAVRLLDPGNQQDPVGSAIQLQVTSLNAADGQSPQFAASGLPPGLSISSSGLITGTISSTASGRYTVTVTATSSTGATGSVSFLWTVAPNQPAPPLSPSASPSASASPFALPSASPSPSSSVSASASASPSASDSASPSPTPSDSTSVSAAASPTPSASDSPSPSPTPSDSVCASPSPSPSDSPSPSPSPTPSDSDSACASPSPSPSDTATPSASASPSAST
jgi:GH25 family lysozyme M1 (1,4-beta-N-acetylmuramidase)